MRGMTENGDEAWVVKAWSDFFGYFFVSSKKSNTYSRLKYKYLHSFSC